MAVATDWRSFLGATAFVAAREQVNTLNVEIRNLDNQIANLKTEKVGLESALAVTLTPAQRASTEAEIAKLNTQIAALAAERAAKSLQRTNLQTEVTKATTDIATAQAATSAKDGGAPSAPTVDAGSAANKPVVYNIGGVKDAYFGNISLMDNGRVGLVGRGGVVDKNTYINNTPARVTDALQLWNTVQASKGMIQTYIPKNNYFNDVFAGVDAASASDIATVNNFSSMNKYGFQFLYNPQSISMGVSGAAAVDYMKYVASPVKVMPDTGATGFINFSLVLNRMHDFQYINADGSLKNGLTIEQVYGSAATAGATEEIKQIHRLGTMYDIEYLFKTVVGFEVKTQFRGTTADLGFLIGRLVELHVGKAMRYLVVINSIDITHALFDSRMVPLSSVVNISASRVPDFQGIATEG